MRKPLGFATVSKFGKMRRNYLTQSNEGWRRTCASMAAGFDAHIAGMDARMKSGCLWGPTNGHCHKSGCERIEPCPEYRQAIEEQGNAE